MGERSKVLDLPEATRAELDARLFEGGFSGYVELEAWLQGQGFEIGKSSIHRYGTRLEERMNALKRATDQAKALVAASPDDMGDMAEALTRLMSERLFTLLMEMEIDPEKADLGKIAKALAPLLRAQIAQRKYAQEVRERLVEADKRVQEASATGRMKGVTPEALAQIRAIYTGAVVGPQHSPPAP